MVRFRLGMNRTKEIMGENKILMTIVELNPKIMVLVVLVKKWAYWL